MNFSETQTVESIVGACQNSLVEEVFTTIKKTSNSNAYHFDVSCMSARHAEVVGEFTHYFMHNYCVRRENFVREHKIRALPKKKRMKKVVIPKLDMDDWISLEYLTPSERVCVFEHVCEKPFSGARHLELKQKIKELLINNIIVKEWLRNYQIEEGLCFGEETPCDWEEQDEYVKDLTEEGIEPNPGPADDNVNPTSALNEFLQLSRVTTLEVYFARVAQTEDHTPLFKCTLRVRMLDGCSYETDATMSSKVEARKKASFSLLEFIVAGEEYRLDILGPSHWIRDLLREGIEANPGPNQSKMLRDFGYENLKKIKSHPSCARYNEPRVMVLEKARRKFLKKIQEIDREMARDAKRPQAQMFEDTKALFSRLKNVTENDFSSVSEDIHRITNFVETALPMMQESFEKSCMSSTDKLVSVKDDLIKIIILVILIKLLFKFEKYRIAVVLVLSFMVYQFGVPECIIQLVRDLKEQVINLTIKRPQAQMGTEDFIYSDVFSIAGKILFGIMAFVCVKAIPGKKDWDSFILRLDRIPKAVAGAGKIVDMTDHYWNIAYDHVKMMVLGKTREELKTINSLTEEIKEWANDVRKYLVLEERKKLDVHPEIANKVEGLWRQGLKFKEEQLSYLENQMVTAFLHPAKMLYELVSSSAVKGGSPRMRPITIWLVGSSGIGKTEVVYPLCIDILRKMGVLKPEDFATYTYARQVETEFHDGYNSQKIVIYDDAFQLKDDKTKPNPEFMEVIRSCNTFPQHLHMAALHDKNTFSQAEVLIYTTNEMEVNIESLTHPDAFKTRMYDNCYVVSPKPEYGIEETDNVGKVVRVKLDKTKVPKDKIDLSIYQFQKMNANKEKCGKPIDYEAFSALMGDSWLKAKEESLSKLAWLREYACRPLAQMGRDNEMDDAASGVYVDCEDEDFHAFMVQGLREGKTLAALEAEIALDDNRWNAYCVYKDKVVESAETKYQKLFKMYDRFCERCKILKNEAYRIVTEHPVLSALAFVGMGLTIFTMYSSMSSLLAVDKADEEDDISEPICEMGQSGDMKTARQPRTRVEMVQSGDNKTARAPRVNIEDAVCDEEQWKKEKQRRKDTCQAIGSSLVACAMTRAAAPPLFRVAGSVVRWLQNRNAEVESCKPVDTCGVCDDRMEMNEFSGPDYCRQCADQLLIEEGMLKIGDVQSQGCSDSQAMFVLQDVIRKNTYRMKYVGDRELYLGNITFLKGWSAVMPFHYVWRLLNEKCLVGELWLYQYGNEPVIKFPVPHILRIDGSNTGNMVRLKHLKAEPGDKEQQDCVVMCLHRTMCHAHKDLLKHIVTQEDLTSIRNGMRGSLATFATQQDGSHVPTYHTFGEIKAVDRELEIDLNSSHFHVQRDYYSYVANTSNGDCGSMVVIYNKRLQRKIIGMHVAGDAQMNAYACKLFREQLDKALETLALNNPAAQFLFEINSEINPLADIAMPEGVFVSVGKHKKKVGQACTSAIIPSRLHNKITLATTKPALLRSKMIDGKLIDPLMLGLKKCGVVPVLLNVDNLSACKNDVQQVICFNYQNLDVKFYKQVLNFEQGVLGKDDDYMRAINRTTSPGFPYSGERQGKGGKKKWFGSGVEYDLTSQECKNLEIDVSNLINDCKNGIIRNVFCMDSKKDERREIAKVDAGKTRVFSACPVHFVIAFRQYFLGFAAFLMHNKIDNEITVGTNVYSLDWHKTALKLKERGECVIAGDFSNFDGSLNVQVLWAILDIINDWYDDGEVNKQIRLGLWTHIVHSVHIFDSVVYMWTHSQPSGNPFTVIINSIYNSIIMRMAWMQCMSSVGMSGMSNFNRHVSMVSYGDDNVLNISKRAIEHFNQTTISAALKTLGHEYTDENKTGGLIEYRKLDDVLFLKRAFVFNEEIQRYVAPLRIDVIYEMLNWTRNTVDPDEILKSNLETAAREMVLHGHDVFDKFVAHVDRVRNILRFNPKIATYQEYIYDYVYNPDSFIV